MNRPVPRLVDGLKKQANTTWKYSRPLPDAKTGSTSGVKPNATYRRLVRHKDEVKGLRCRLRLIHIEVAFEDALLHGVGNSGLLGHLAGRRFHDGHALCALVGRRMLLLLLLLRVDGVDAGHGGAFGAAAEVLCEIVAFACVGKHSRQLVFSECMIRMTLEMLDKKAWKIRRSRR